MAQGLRERLIGTWKLVSYVEKPVDGSAPFYPMGEEPHGIIMYTPDGYMSAQLMHPGRPRFASGDWFRGTDEEKQTLTHSMFVSLFPNWLGQTQPRVVEIEGDMLHLSSATPIMKRCSAAHMSAFGTKRTFQRAINSPVLLR